MNHLSTLKGLPRYEKAEDLAAKHMSSVDEAMKLYGIAQDKGITFWQLLEFMNPSQGGDPLTAFDRQMKTAGILTKSDPDRGLFASTGEYFFQSDKPGSAILFPVLLQKAALWAKMKGVNDINKIVASTRTISGSSSYQSLMIDDSEIRGAKDGGTGSGRRFRVDQRGHFPVVKIGWSEKANSVTKHGVRLEWTYEFIRRSSIELIQTVVSRIMLQDQQEVFDEAVDLAINGVAGDAANPAATVKVFTTKAVPGANEIPVPAGTPAGAVPYEGYLRWIGSFMPYTPSVVCGNLNTIVKLIVAEKPNMDPMEIITRIQEQKSQGTASLVDSGLFPKAQLYVVDTMADDQLMGIDPDYAMERVIELGSDIKEVERVIRNQTEAMVISIADNTSKIWYDAIQVLDFSAIPTA